MKVLEVRDISKIYRLGEVGTGTISHDLNRWFHKVRGKEDPYQLVTQINDRNQHSESEYIYALKDINFDVNQGEILGIIGRNGAGKSTLLKILSKITAPSSGTIKSKGRIASLLEVGTGMHPEMTAKENIYLNGAILGMTRKEIDEKFDEILDFSGCTMYIDTPIKRFSSGMRVRLGFAVAAFLEPEILIVDEVLAVGDDEFQKKAISKMKDISNEDNRTVLFVSHNMSAVKKLCTRGLLIDKGKIVANDSIDNIIQLYNANSNEHVEYKNETRTSGNFLMNAKVEASINEFSLKDQISISFKAQCEKTHGNNARMLIRFMDRWDHVICSSEIKLKEGVHPYNCKFKGSSFVKGAYKINVIIYEPGVMQYDNIAECCNFSIIENKEVFVHLETFNIGNTYFEPIWE